MLHKCSYYIFEEELFTKQENKTTKWLVGQWICEEREEGVGVGMAGREDNAAGTLGGLGPAERERCGFWGVGRGDQRRERLKIHMRMKREKHGFWFGRMTKRERKRQAREFGNRKRERWDVREGVTGLTFC
jgi:hypothetical protein